MKRIKREQKTVKAMVEIFCADHKHPGHGRKLCEACSELLGYANERLGKCMFGEGKPTCAQCPVHCYKPEKRSEITEVMRFSGPKMLFRRPLLALAHLVDGKKKPSQKVLAYQKVRVV